MSNNSVYATQIELNVINSLVKCLGFNDLLIYIKNSNKKFELYTGITSESMKNNSHSRNNNKTTIKLLYTGINKGAHYSFVIHPYEKEHRRPFNNNITQQIFPLNSNSLNLTQKEISQLLAQGAFNLPSNGRKKSPLNKSKKSQMFKQFINLLKRKSWLRTLKKYNNSKFNLKNEHNHVLISKKK